MGKGTSINYPEQQPYGEGMREALQAQVELAPALYAGEASQAYGRPAYARLETDILKDTLLGQQPRGRGIETEQDKWEAYVDLDPRLTANWERQGPLAQKFRGDKAAWGKQHYERHGRSEGRFLPEVGKAYQSTAAPVAAQPVISEEERYERHVMSDPQLRRDWENYKVMGDPRGRYKPRTQKYSTAMAWLKRDGRGTTLPPAPAPTPSAAPQITEMAAEPEGGYPRQGGLMELIGAPAQQFEAGGEMRRPGYDPSGQFGGLAQYGADIAQFGATRQRAADIRDVGMMGQEASRAIREADPLSAVLMSEMGGQAIEELGARDALTARERRGAVQEARQAMEARGRQLDPMAAVAELENLERAKRARRMERRGFAQQAMGASRAMSADPFMAILGRPSGAGQQIAQQGMGQAGYGLSAGPQLYSPESGLSYMLGQQTNQMNLAGAQASADAQRSAGMMGMAGSILAAPMTGGTSLLGTAFGQ